MRSPDVDQNLYGNRDGHPSKKNFYHEKLYSETEILDIPEEFQSN